MKNSNNEQKYYGYIYLIYDQKHKKIYIGQKKGLIEQSSNYYGSGKIIQRIIKDRGIYFLKKTIIGICYSKEELQEAEKECIIFFQSRNYIYGYNIAKGGDGGDTLSNHPDKDIIYKKAAKKREITLNNNPEINIKRGLKSSFIQKNKSQIEKDLIIQKQKNIILNRTSEEWEKINKKIKDKEIKTKIINKSIVGKNNPRYIKIDYIFIIKIYFLGIEAKLLINIYNENYDNKLYIDKYRDLLKILKLPYNYSKKYRKNLYSIYLRFIEENKDKIDWYIENYERLEQEYFENKHHNKHKEFFTNINRVYNGDINE